MYDTKKKYRVMPWGDHGPELPGTLEKPKDGKYDGQEGFFFHPVEESIFHGLTLFVSLDLLQKFPPKELKA